MGQRGMSPWDYAGPEKDLPRRTGVLVGTPSSRLTGSRSDRSSTVPSRAAALVI
jgi:hypothetical protein